MATITHLLSQLCKINGMSSTTKKFKKLLKVTPLVQGTVVKILISLYKKNMEILNYMNKVLQMLRMPTCSSI
jgi:hypothetical protein